MREDVKNAYVAVMETAKFIFQWGFVPTIVYLGNAIIFWESFVDFNVVLFCNPCLNYSEWSFLNAGLRRGADPGQPAFNILRCVSMLDLENIISYTWKFLVALEIVILFRFKCFMYQTYCSMAGIQISHFNGLVWLGLETTCKCLSCELCFNCYNIFYYSVLWQ